MYKKHVFPDSVFQKDNTGKIPFAYLAVVFLLLITAVMIPTMQMAIGRASAFCQCPVISQT